MGVCELHLTCSKGSLTALNSPKHDLSTLGLAGLVYLLMLTLPITCALVTLRSHKSIFMMPPCLSMITIVPLIKMELCTLYYKRP